MEQDSNGYVELNTSLRIVVRSDPTDLLVLSIVNGSLNRISNRVAFDLLSVENPKIAEKLQAFSMRSRYYWDPHYVRAKIISAKAGSLDQIVQFTLSTVFSNPNLVAVLQNLAANIVWSVATALPKHIKRTFTDQSPKTAVGVPSVDGQVRAMVSRLAEIGTSCTLELSAKKSDGTSTKLTFTIPARNDRDN
jgi:hypothetical protein